jgi:ubiquitin
MQYPTIVNNTVYKFLIPLLLAFAAISAQAKMYKWVDDQGNVHYSDTLPPDSAGQGNAELGKTGRFVKKAESAEEKAKRQAAQAEAAVLKKQADEQKRKDRALLSTYTSEQEIDLSRDRALEHHKLIINSAQARRKQVEPSANDLAKKVEAASKKGKPVPEHLQQEYNAKRAEIADIQRTIKTNEDAMVALRERYEADKLRFRELNTRRSAGNPPSK